ncbi:MAG: hypothetical protein HUJ94_08435 [Bacteroidales bacterium]|nr:hypothetical protein [Bacteroidales bacterium]
MKRILKYISAALVLTLSAACNQEAYEKGEFEDPDCYGVYFPRQSTATTIEIEPGGMLEARYVVRRTSILDEITVPVKITVSEEDIFFVEPIHFDAGEDETSFAINFPEAKNGVEYTLDIDIVDPKYVSIYGSRTTSLSISLLIANWKSLGMGKWRDDIVSSMYAPPHPNVEIEVEIFEREDLPGYLRMKPYTSDFINALFDVTMETENKWIYIDATNPEEVFIPHQGTGMTLSQEQGELIIASYSDDDFSIDASDCQYGTMVEKVITFPERGILCRLDKYMEADEWAYANVGGLQRIILPGGRVYDYSVKLVKHDPQDGKVDIDVSFGQDVSYVRYAVFEGTLSDGDVSLNAQSLDAGELSFADEVVSDSRAVSLSPTQGTGLYTLVACCYDANGSMQGYEGIHFGYIAAGEDLPLKLRAGLELTDEYTGKGMTSANSVRFYAYGEDIESIEYGLYKKSKIAGKDYGTLLDQSGTKMNKEDLEAVNNKHFSAMLSGLNGDSEYTLLLRAYNGYYSRILDVSVHTLGRFNPILETYEYSDFTDLQFSKNELTSTKWHLYATDLLDDDDNPHRKFIGEVTIQKDDYDDGAAIDYFGLTGFTRKKFDTGGKMLAMYLPDADSQYQGTLAPLAQQDAIGTINGEDIFIGYIPVEDIYNMYLGLGMFVGRVTEDCMYFVPAQSAIEQGYTFYYMYIGGSKTSIALYEDIIMVRADADPGLEDDPLPWEVATKSVKTLDFGISRRKTSLADVQSYVAGRRTGGIKNYAADVNKPTPVFGVADYKTVEK